MQRVQSEQEKLQITVMRRNNIAVTVNTSAFYKT